MQAVLRDDNGAGPARVSQPVLRDDSDHAPGSSVISEYSSGDPSPLRPTVSGEYSPRARLPGVTLVIDEFLRILSVEVEGLVVLGEELGLLSPHLIPGSRAIDGHIAAPDIPRLVQANPPAMRREVIHEHGDQPSQLALELRKVDALTDHLLPRDDDGAEPTSALEADLREHPSRHALAITDTSHQSSGLEAE